MCQRMCKKHIKMHYQALPEDMGSGREWVGGIEELSIKEYIKEYINMVIYRVSQKNALSELCCSTVLPILQPPFISCE